MLGTPPAFILSQDQTLRSILVCRFPVRGNRRVSQIRKNKSEFKEVSNNVLSGMYQSVFRGASSMPSVRHSIRFSRCRGGSSPRSRLVAAQERIIPAFRIPCQGKFSRNFPTRFPEDGTAAMIINITIIHFSVYRRLFSLPEDRRRYSDKKRRWERSFTNTW